VSLAILRTVPAPPALEPIADRIRDLQAEASDLARDHVAAFVAALQTAARLGAEIAGGGELYPVGVRDLARRLAESLGKDALTLRAIADRGP